MPKIYGDKLHPMFKKHMGASHPHEYVVTKEDIARTVSNELGIPIGKWRTPVGGFGTYDVIGIITDTIIETLSRHKNVYIEGFGKFFFRRKKKGACGINCNTGEIFRSTEQRYYLCFEASEELKKELRKPLTIK